MANPRVPLTVQSYTAYQADVSTASSAFVAIDRDGVVTAIRGLTRAAITTAPNVITVELNGTAVSGAGGSMSHSGAAAGLVYDMAVPKGLIVKAGDALEIVSDGAGSGTVPTDWTVSVDTGKAL